MCMNKIWISLSKIKYYIRVVFAYRTRTNRNHGLSFNGYMKTARRLLEEDRIVGAVSRVCQPGKGVFGKVCHFGRERRGDGV